MKIQKLISDDPTTGLKRRATVSQIQYIDFVNGEMKLKTKVEYGTVTNGVPQVIPDLEKVVWIDISNRNKITNDGTIIDRDYALSVTTLSPSDGRYDPENPDYVEGADYEQEIDAELQALQEAGHPQFDRWWGFVNSQTIEDGLENTLTIFDRLGKFN